MPGTGAQKRLEPDPVAGILRGGRVLDGKRHELGSVVGGGGGGRPNMAQAGGKNPEKAQELWTQQQESLKNSSQNNKVVRDLQF